MDTTGYRATTACTVAGITYRQLDYWARTGLVCPSVAAAGSGSQRLYSWGDVLKLRLVAKLLAAGLSLPKVRAALAEIARFDDSQLQSLTLMTDGTTVYQASSADEIVDLLRGGHLVLGVCLEPIAAEIDVLLADERVVTIEEHTAGDVEMPVVAGDEVAARRRRRSA